MRVLLDYISGPDHKLDLLIRDFSLAHPLFCMGGDEIPVLQNRLP